MRRRARSNCLHIQRIIAHHFDFRTQGLEILHQIPGKGVVVIDHQQFIVHNNLNLLII